MVKGTKEDASSLEGLDGKHLADRWGLPFREAHTLSIDPAALEIVDREESRRLGVLPVEIGEDGPVFAVAEPSEEKFAAVRDMAGDNSSFVVVSKATLDALLNSRVFSAQNPARRPSLFRRPGDQGDTAASAPAPSEGEAPAAEPEGAEQSAPSSPTGDDSTSALDNLLTQIASGAGTLRAQVDELTASLETTQRELREAKEQLADAHRIAETHEATVTGLNAEIARLGDELSRSTALNSSMTSRLEQLARTLQPAGEPGT